MPSNDPLATFEGCSIVMADGRPCARPLHKDQSGVDERPVCVMHSRDPKKRVGDFGENIIAILNGVSPSNRIAARYDFTGFVFPDNDFRRNYAKEVVFKGATFSLHANFSGSTFAGPVDFTKATFAGGANFNKVSFGPSFGFSLAKFGGDAIFTEMKFGCPADFTGATFEQSADFSELNFPNEARFDRVCAKNKITFTEASFRATARFLLANLAQAEFLFATFHSNADFHEANFLKKASFFSAKFHFGASFTQVTFEQVVNFSATTFGHDALFWNTTFVGGASFTGTTFHRKADFSHVAFGTRGKILARGEAIADFQDVRFEEPSKTLFHHINKNSTQGLRLRLLMSYVENVSFGDIHWHGEADRKMVLQDELDITTPLKLEDGKTKTEENLNEETHGAPDVPYEQVAITYRQLINNFEKVRAFDLAEDCWYGVREMKRLNPFHFVLERRLVHYYKKWRWLRWLGERLSLLYLYQKASGYGCSHKRAFEVLLVIVFAFAVAYPVIGLDETIQNKHNVHLGIRSISEMAKAYLAGWLHSLEVATFQRSPMYVPSDPLGRLAEIVETILVPVQVSLLLLALRRRFRTGSSSGSA